jgi:hypothetical protein
MVGVGDAGAGTTVGVDDAGAGVTVGDDDEGSQLTNSAKLTASTIKLHKENLCFFTLHSLAKLPAGACRFSGRGYCTTVNGLVPEQIAPGHEVRHYFLVLVRQDKGIVHQALRGERLVSQWCQVFVRGEK